MLATRAVMGELGAAAASAPAGFEVGGVLLLEDRPSRGDVVYGFEQWTNLAGRPGEFKAAELYDWQATPDRIFVHSHPRGHVTLSPGDVDYAVSRGGTRMALYAVAIDALYVWDVAEDGTEIMLSVEVEGERRARRVAARPGRR